ncbi:MAG: hypothetical protein BWX89_00637 [candidate division TA06 bacterium ADurb.Bin131]|uniref:Carbohydrate-binding domain-containing protein n=1 Tax=candidate division TA06 bacterium ADurb.Bin131 TaxID=1852827 RepID=A0A1V6CB75_UNCT6|nr:MAG: hypothetical protein BWX89_00637 [candidate division TA06 bacterium ADurb.Bin131]HOC03709.1 carbohydrate-binding family 9-like protein [bacterium]
MCKNKKSLYPIFCLFIFLPCIQPFIKAEDFESPEIVCNRAHGKIIVDGWLNEPAWKNAEKIDFVRIISFEKPDMETKAFCLYDDEYLYIGFIMYDMDIWGIYEKRDSLLYDEDVVEVFLKPNLSKDPYYEFEVSPRNIVLDAYLGNRTLAGNMFLRFAKWNCPGLKTAVKVKGTLNNWEDIDEYWSVEIAIPFRSLPSLKKAPLPDDIWLINLGRYDYSIYQKNINEVTTCSPITKFDFHRYEEWRFIRYK